MVSHRHPSRIRCEAVMYLSAPLLHSNPVLDPVERTPPRAGQARTCVGGGGLEYFSTTNPLVLQKPVTYLSRVQTRFPQVKYFFRSLLIAYAAKSNRILCYLLIISVQYIPGVKVILITVMKVMQIIKGLEPSAPFSPSASASGEDLNPTRGYQ
jgi:hypothetical protein